MRQRAERWLRVLWIAGLTAAGAWLAARFLLPWAAPFLLSFAIAALMEPGVRWLVRHRWRRSLAAGILSLGVLALLIWGVSALVNWLAGAISRFAGQVPALAAGMAQGLGRLETRALRMIEAAPPELEESLRLSLDTMSQNLYALPGQLSQAALDALRRLAQQGPDVLLFAATAGIGSYFCSASYPRVLAFLAAQIPQKLRQRLDGLGRDLKGSFGGWFRAQLLLMGICFFELLLTFLLLRLPGAAGLAALVAVIDALPVFGVGTVLIPWGLVCLLLGQIRRGAGLVAACGVITLAQNALQAKLLGDQIGLDPLASLMAMYVGWRVWSVWGMILFPVLLVTLCQLNDKGVVRLWRKV